MPELTAILLELTITLLEFAATLLKLAITLLKLTITLLKLAITLLELAVICQKSIKLVEFGRIYLLSVLLKYSYCNWASPIIIPPLLAKGLK